MPLLTYALHHIQLDGQEPPSFESRNLSRTHIKLCTGDQETNPLVGPISELLNDGDTKYFFTDTQPDQFSAAGVYLVNPSDTTEWKLFIILDEEKKSFPLHYIDGLKEALENCQLNNVNEEEIKNYFKRSEETIFNYTIKNFLAPAFPHEEMQDELLKAIKLHVISDCSIFSSSLGLLNFFFDLSISDFYEVQEYQTGKDESPYSIFTIVNPFSNPEIEITREKKLRYVQGHTTHMPATISVSCRIGIDPTSNTAYINFLHRELRIDNTTFIRQMRPLTKCGLTVPPLVSATFANAKEDRAYPKFDFTDVRFRDQERVLYKLMSSINTSPENEKVILYIKNSTALTNIMFKEIVELVGSRQLEVTLIGCSEITEKSIQSLQESAAHLTALTLIANKNIREIQTSIVKKERHFPHLQFLQLEDMPALGIIKLRTPLIHRVIMQNLPCLTECHFFGTLRQLQDVSISEELTSKITIPSQQLTLFSPSTSSVGRSSQHPIPTVAIQ